MSAPVQRRIEALEARQSEALGCVWRHEGETAGEAQKRAEFNLYDEVIIFSWASSPSNGAAT